MGKAIKTLAVAAIGAAIAITTGGAGGFFMTSLGLGSTAAMVAGGLLGAVASSVAGKILGVGEVDLESTNPISNYATSSLSNSTDNNNVRPILYGQGRIGGNRVFADLEDNGTNNNHLYEIIVFTGHECNDFIDLMANSESMTQGTGSDTDKYRFAEDNILAQVYTNKPTTIQAITDYSGGTWTTADLNSISFQNTPFADSTIPDDCCFCVVHFIYDSSDNNSRKTITAELQGKKVRTITDSSTINSTKTYSNNPAEVVLDFLTTQKVFNISDTKISISDFYSAKQFCSNNSFSTNISFTSSTNRSAAMQELLATFRGSIIYSQGLYKLKHDGIFSNSFTIESSDIISGTFNWSQKKTADLANKLYVTYIEPADSYQTKQTEYIQDDDLIASDGREYITKIAIRGVTNEAQANLLRELAFNQYRYTEDEEGNRLKVTPLTITFLTTIKNASLEVGDIGLIRYDELPRDVRIKIISIKTKQSGQLDIVATEYSETYYKNSSNNIIIT